MSNPMRILSATDFSAPSDQAVAYGLKLARELGADVHLVNVCEPPTLPELVNVEALVLDELERVAYRHLCAMVADLRERPAVIEPRVAVGDPRRELVRLVADLDVDLIVVGSHGRRGIRRLVLGSVAEHLVRVAACPVLVVRESALAKS